MSVCKTGCGGAVPDGDYLCEPCWDAWEASPEHRRTGGMNQTRYFVALMEFCNRTRAERISDLQGAWPAVPKVQS